MLFKQRIIHGDNGVLKDISVPLNDLLSGQTAALPIVAAQDFLYIGCDLPFTNRFFRMGSVVNAALSAISEIAIWDGGNWVPAVDVIDQTSAAAATLARNGVVSWTTPRNSGWGQEASTENMTGSGLTTLKIYDFYWVRLRFSVDLTAGTLLEYMDFEFSNDADLGGYYPDLVNPAVMAAFKAGKTNWTDQHCLAAEEIIVYLRRKQFIWSPSQLLNWQQFTLASIHKCAEIIYSAFPGDDFEDRRALADKKYHTAMNQGSFEVDRNEDGRVEPCERRFQAGLSRS